MGWCDWAEHDPGPSWKINSGLRRGSGAVLHSMEGSLENALARLQGTDQVSWHFSVAKDGTVLQHYDTTLQTWHARAAGNPFYVGIEHEGKAGEPETDEQVGADIRILTWLAEGPYARGQTLWEHNELTATACPSHRILWDAILQGLYPPTATIVGVGAHYTDGSDEEIWTPREGRVLDGLGARWTDGSITRLWP